MKFSDGNWLNKPGVHVYAPVEVHEVEKDMNSMTIYAPCKPISGRSATLDGPMLTARFSSPMAGVIRVEVCHFVGGLMRAPAFVIRDEGCAVEIEESGEVARFLGGAEAAGTAVADGAAGVVKSEGFVSLKSGALSVRVNRRNFALDFYHEKTRLTGSGRKGMAYIKVEDGVSGQVYMRDQLGLQVGEYVYGLGERFTPFVKNGQVVDIWNRDGGTNSEQAYKNIPFYITNKGYGVFVNHPERVSFEIGSEVVSRAQFSVPGEVLDYFIIDGPTMKDVLARYMNLTGKPALPPAWSFGLWLTTSFTTNYNEETVNHFVDGMISRGIPLRVFHFDCFWMKEFEWCNFEWDTRVFPDPVEMLRRLKNKGLKICVWINSYIAQKSKLFAEAESNGYLLKKPNGDVWQWDLWQAGMGIVDFTNPSACTWYTGKLQALIDMGVDSFKTDFGERIPTNVVYFDGADPEKMHNYYTFNPSANPQRLRTGTRTLPHTRT